MPGQSSGPSATVPLRVAGLATPLSLYLHGPADRVVSRTLRETGMWEPFESHLVLQLLAPGSVFVDAGANIGYFTLLAASAVGESGAVFAFEPEPENFRLLEASVAFNGLGDRVNAIMAGLADRETEGRLYLSRDNLGDHQIFPDEPGRDSVLIRLLRGSDYFSGQVDRIDLLKVDVQGAETAVINGLMPFLQSQAGATRILLELTPHSLRSAGSSGRELIELLATLDERFWIVDHLEHRLVPSTAPALAQWCDGVDSVPGDRGFMNILVGRGLAAP